MKRDDDAAIGSPASNRAIAAIAGAEAALCGVTQALERQHSPVVLVIDDAEDSRDLYAHFLDLKGYRVVTASDGRAGLQIAREVRPDVIVLDLGLPFVDGWEITRLLRADPLTKAICIIACSGFAATKDQQRAFEAGVDVFLVKPCSPEVLQAALVERWPPPAEASVNSAITSS